ncbi:hypothetical protein I3F60_03935 [Streptomyces sp. MUM 136J]|uniref:beta/gamma crystallin domain-containing protein n=1 Tax=Streptomyces sp. MUM 136J TaxID=2791992 RepID=UPI001F03E9D0|nr:beta/gamma crystallin domain-containing protein [Streptomyces sp. MUM 136J]MCH0568415.1 hypothetical protein [Streptomyces sp. MUM 136J]
MNQRAKQVVLSALTTFAAAASLTFATASSASAIDQVDCGLRTDFAKILAHSTGSQNNQESCFANAGEMRWGRGAYAPSWLVQFSTGNNRVQWHGDGRWQPGAPVAKWTVFSFPNHPGGVKIDGLKIW